MKARSEFLKVAVKAKVKRAIDIIAAKEQRRVYQVVADMVEAYEKSKQGGSLSTKT